MGTGSALEPARGTMGHPMSRALVRVGVKVNRTRVAVSEVEDDLYPCGTIAGTREGTHNAAEWRKVAKSIARLVPVSSTCHHAYTAGLSTW
jgi:hypothetical protein